MYFIIIIIIIIIIYYYRLATELPDPELRRTLWVSECTTALCDITPSLSLFL